MDENPEKEWPGYATRQFRDLEPLLHEGWFLRVHGIAAKGERPSAAAVAAGLGAARGALPQPARTDTRYGVGFLVIHEGMDALWVLVHWWEDVCLLHQRLFSAALDDVAAIRPAPSESLVACTWELACVEWERRAWVTTIQAADIDASLEAYKLLRRGNFEI